MDQNANLSREEVACDLEPRLPNISPHHLPQPLPVVFPYEGYLSHLTPSSTVVAHLAATLKTHSVVNNVMFAPPPNGYDYGRMEENRISPQIVKKAVGSLTFQLGARADTTIDRVKLRAKQLLQQQSKTHFRFGSNQSQSDGISPNVNSNVSPSPAPSPDQRTFNANGAPSQPSPGRLLCDYLTNPHSGHYLAALSTANNVNDFQQQSVATTIMNSPLMSSAKEGYGGVIKAVALVGREVSTQLLMLPWEQERPSDASLEAVWNEVVVGNSDDIGEDDDNDAVLQWGSRSPGGHSSSSPNLTFKSIGCGVNNKAISFFLKATSGLSGHGTESCPIPCMMIKNPKAKFLLLAFHANATDVGFCSEKGFFFSLSCFFPCTVLLVEYPGYGLHTGEPSELTVKQTAERVVQYVCSTSTNLSPRQILIYGMSIGTGVAAHAAAVITEAGHRWEQKSAATNTTTAEDPTATSSLFRMSPPRWWHRLGGLILAAPYCSVAEIPQLKLTTNQTATSKKITETSTNDATLRSATNVESTRAVDDGDVTTAIQTPELRSGAQSPPPATAEGMSTTIGGGSLYMPNPHNDGGTNSAYTTQGAGFLFNGSNIHAFTGITPAASVADQFSSQIQKKDGVDKAIISSLPNLASTTTTTTATTRTSNYASHNTLNLTHNNNSSFAIENLKNDQNAIDMARRRFLFSSSNLKQQTASTVGGSAAASIAHYQRHNARDSSIAEDDGRFTGSIAKGREAFNDVEEITSPTMRWKKNVLEPRWMKGREQERESKATLLERLSSAVGLGAMDGGVELGSPDYDGVEGSPTFLVSHSSSSGSRRLSSGAQDGTPQAPPLKPQPVPTPLANIEEKSTSDSKIPTQLDGTPVIYTFEPADLSAIKMEDISPIFDTTSSGSVPLTMERTQALIGDGEGIASGGVTEPDQSRSDHGLMGSYDTVPSIESGQSANAITNQQTTNLSIQIPTSAQVSPQSLPQSPATTTTRRVKSRVATEKYTNHHDLEDHDHDRGATQVFEENELAVGASLGEDMVSTTTAGSKKSGPVYHTAVPSAQSVRPRLEVNSDDEDEDTLGGTNTFYQHISSFGNTIVYGKVVRLAALTAMDDDDQTKLDVMAASAASLSISSKNKMRKSHMRRSTTESKASEAKSSSPPNQNLNFGQRVFNRVNQKPRKEKETDTTVRGPFGSLPLRHIILNRFTTAKTLSELQKKYQCFSTVSKVTIECHKKSEEELKEAAAAAAENKEAATAHGNKIESGTKVDGAFTPPMGVAGVGTVDATTTTTRLQFKLPEANDQLPSICALPADLYTTTILKNTTGGRQDPMASSKSAAASKEAIRNQWPIKYNTRIAVESVGVPLLLLHGKFDETILCEHSFEIMTRICGAHRQWEAEEEEVRNTKEKESNAGSKSDPNPRVKQTEPALYTSGSSVSALPEPVGKLQSTNRNNKYVANESGFQASARRRSSNPLETKQSEVGESQTSEVTKPETASEPQPTSAAREEPIAKFTTALVSLPNICVFLHPFANHNSMSEIDVDIIQWFHQGGRVMSFGDAITAPLVDQIRQLELSGGGDNNRNPGNSLQYLPPSHLAQTLLLDHRPKLCESYYYQATALALMEESGIGNGASSSTNPNAKQEVENGAFSASVRNAKNIVQTQRVMEGLFAMSNIHRNPLLGGQPERQIPATDPHADNSGTAVVQVEDEEKSAPAEKESNPFPVESVKASNQDTSSGPQQNVSTQQLTGGKTGLHKKLIRELTVAGIRQRRITPHPVTNRKRHSSGGSKGQLGTSSTVDSPMTDRADSASDFKSKRAGTKSSKKAQQESQEAVAAASTFDEPQKPYIGYNEKTAKSLRQRHASRIELLRKVIVAAVLSCAVALIILMGLYITSSYVYSDFMSKLFASPSVTSVTDHSSLYKHAVQSNFIDSVRNPIRLGQNIVRQRYRTAPPDDSTVQFIGWNESQFISTLDFTTCLWGGRSNGFNAAAGLTTEGDLEGISSNVRRGLRAGPTLRPLVVAWFLGEILVFIGVGVLFLLSPHYGLSQLHRNHRKGSPLSIAGYFILRVLVYGIGVLTFGILIGGVLSLSPSMAEGITGIPFTGKAQETLWRHTTQRILSSHDGMTHNGMWFSNPSTGNPASVVGVAAIYASPTSLSGYDCIMGTVATRNASRAIGAATFAHDDTVLYITAALSSDYISDYMVTGGMSANRFANNVGNERNPNFIVGGGFFEWMSDRASNKATIGNKAHVITSRSDNQVALDNEGNALLVPLPGTNVSIVKRKNNFRSIFPPVEWFQSISPTEGDELWQGYSTRYLFWAVEMPRWAMLGCFIAHLTHFVWTLLLNR